jgi:homoserine kinase
MAMASAPASSANLGPGFDVLALALDIRCEVEVVADAEWSVTSNGRHVDDDTAAVVREMAGEEPKAIFIRSDIPMARGLGSSAAVRVAAAAAAAAEGGSPVDHEELLRLAAVAEGHPDNAAAAVYGGLVFVDAVGSVHRLGVHPSIEVVVAVPDEPLTTSEARSVLPDMVSRAATVRTAARIAALIEGLRTADPAVLAAAAGDEVHESARAELSPVSADLVAAAAGAGALHSCWSGAGPSVVAFVTEATSEPVRAVFEEILEGRGVVMEPAIDRTGLVVER